MSLWQQICSIVPPKTSFFTNNSKLYWFGIYDKRDDFNFDIAIFPFLDGDVPQSPSLVYIYFNLFALPEHLRMLLTSIIVTNY